MSWVKDKILDRKWFREFMIWGTIGACTLIMVTLCFDKGMDFDEAFSYSTTYGKSLKEIWERIVSAQDVDIPFWYWCLRIWTMIFGESWLVYKLFPLAGTVATMILGATVVRRNWGYMAAFLFVVPVSMSSAMLHISVNVRYYSWTVFVVTACGLLAYSIVTKGAVWWKWLLLFLLTFAGTFSHYYTAFCFVVIYLYLFMELFRTKKKEIWKIFVCGGLAVIPTILWLWKTGTLSRESSGSALSLELIDFKDLFTFMFETNIAFSVAMGTGLLLMSFLGLLIFQRRWKAEERIFLYMCLLMVPVTYIMGAVISSGSAHFYTPRHVMHGMGLMWLVIAIVLSRINWKVFVGVVLFYAATTMSSYSINFDMEYNRTPYIEQTLDFIEGEMQAGDIVIYNAEIAFVMLYKCYMPEQEFIHVSNITDLQDLVGKRVWYFNSNSDMFSYELWENYDLAQQFKGHYGFQIINNCTDFDVYEWKISRKTDAEE